MDGATESGHGNRGDAEPATVPHPLRRARVAISAVFAVHGAVTGSFATRVPWVQEHVGVSPGQLGLALAFPAIGSVLAMPLAGRISHRFGERAALRVLLSMWTLSLALPALSPNLPVLCCALLVFGASAGMSDVTMNAVGVDTEERLGKSIMSGLHGMWSVGSLAGSAAGVAVTHAHIDARAHLATAAALLALLGVGAGQHVLNIRGGAAEHAPPRFALPPRSALIIGAVGFCAVFAEGASLDWSAIYLRDELATSAGLAAASTTAFTCTMALARLTGDMVVRRFGPVHTVRTCGVLATAGGVAVVTAPHPAVALAGFGATGLGIAVVVPLAFAAAARSGHRASQSIAGVATITYTSGLIAPSAMGSVADLTSLTASFCLVTALATGLVVGAGVLRPAGRAEHAAAPADGAAAGSG